MQPKEALDYRTDGSKMELSGAVEEWLLGPYTLVSELP